MTAKKFNVVAAGRAYIDIVARVDAGFLALHQIPIDGQLECSAAEISQITTNLSAPQMLAGGPSSNTCAVLTALGGHAGFFGKVCRDAAGEFFLTDARQRNIIFCCEPYAENGSMSGTCLVLLTAQHRSFAYNTGCSNFFSAVEFEAFDFSQTDFFLVEAHLLTHADAYSALASALHMAENRTRIVINLHGITAWDAHHGVVKLIAEKANIVVGNSVEQEAFQNAATHYEKNAEQLVITTQGEHGAAARQAGQVWHAAAAKPIRFVSSVGAGDAFIAGLLLALSNGANVQTSLAAAIDAATAILGETGARPALNLIN